MSKPLTAIAVDKLKPRATRYEVADGGQRGLKLVVFPSGGKSFVVRYRVGGVKKKLTLGHVSLAAARKAAAAALFDVHEGRDPAAAKQAAKAKAAEAAADTVEAICRQHLKREGGRMRTVATRISTLERLVFPVIGAKPVGELRRKQIVEMLDAIQDSCGDRTADLAFSYLRAALAWHATRVDDFNSPIVRGMGRHKQAAHARKRVLTNDEVRAIWAATEPEGVIYPFQAFTRFLLFTGARRDEARLLTWAEIKGDKWELPAARNKADFDFTRPLSAAALAVLASIPHLDDSPWIFTTNGRRPLSSTAPKIDIDKRSGVKDWRFHDLRRTARTLMSRAGIDPDHAERCLGHKIGGIRGVYDQHEYQDEMHRAFEALAALIMRIVNPDGNVVPMRRSPLGGSRVWFRCRCGGRVATLFDAGSGFYCRRCLRLGYACQQVTKSWRLIDRAQSLRMRLGGTPNVLDEFPPRPRYMRVAKYESMRRRALASQAEGSSRLGALARPSIILGSTAPIHAAHVRSCLKATRLVHHSEMSWWAISGREQPQQNSGLFDQLVGKR